MSELRARSRSKYVEKVDPELPDAPFKGLPKRSRILPSGNRQYRIYLPDNHVVVREKSPDGIMVSLRVVPKRFSLISFVREKKTK